MSNVKSNCFEVLRPDGMRYAWPIGKVISLQPGERIVGRAEDCYTGNIVRVQPEKIKTEDQIFLETLDHEVKGGLGDVIKLLATPIAKAKGMGSCSSCQKTQIILNARKKLANKIGTIRAFKTIANLAYMAKTGRQDEAVHQLKAILES